MDTRTFFAYLGVAAAICACSPGRIEGANVERDAGREADAFLTDATATDDASTHENDAHTEDDAGEVRADAGDSGDASVDAARPDLGTTTRDSNDAPVARGETFHGATNTAIAITNILANDNDADGDALAFTITEGPEHGVLTATTTGAFTYEPARDYVGEDTFTYRVTDGHGGADTATTRLFIAARIYYIDESGSDSASGLSPSTAWRTPEKVQNHLYSGGFAPGDAVLFKRGGTYRGALGFFRSGTAERPIFLGAYGTGAKPIFSGARAVTGWTAHSGNIYKASFVGGPKYLFANGARQTLARFPNTGFLRSDTGATTHLLDSALTAAAGTYNGARVVMHAVNWAFESTRVGTNAPGRLDYATPLPYVTSANDWGYFLDDALSLLDAPGEWFYDRTTNQIYLWAPGGVNPSTLNVEAAIESRPLELNGNYLIADGLDTRHALEGGLTVSYLNHHITVRDCSVSDAFWGIRVFASDVTLLENEVHDTFDGATYIDGARNVIERNYLHDVSMVPGLGANRWGYMGLTVKGDDARVRHNRIERVGYLGMEVNGNRHLIEENEVSEAVSIFNDGGGIAFDFLDGVIFRRNFVHDTLGSPPSMSSTQTVNYRIAFNMYFGDKSNMNTTLEDNVLQNGSTGIHVDHTTRSAGNILRRNTIYDHTYGVTFSDYSNHNMNTTGSDCVPSYDDRLFENLVFAKNADQLALYFLETHCVDWVRWGSFNDNRYFNPFSSRIAYRHDFQSPRYEYAPGLFGGRHEYFTLAEWTAEPVGLDSRSTSFSLAWTPPASAESTQLVSNPSRGNKRVALTGRWLDLSGASVEGFIDLEPYTAQILLRAP